MSNTITSAGYTYGALITAIYDGDTFICDIDWGKKFWSHDEIVRSYGINANEIKKSKSRGRGQAHVNTGFDHRDDFIEALGLDPDDFPRKVKYHDVKKSILVGLDLDGDGEPDGFDYRQFAIPVPVIIQTVLDKSGKFGRLLGIVHKDGLNINEHLRDIIGGVEFYDRKTYPADHPIRPPK